MPNLTQYTDQEVVNMLYGSRPTQYTVQEAFNLQDGSAFGTQYSTQEVLNLNLGVSPTYYSEQEALWLTLQGDLGLTGSHYQYSVQELLNMSYSQGDVTLPEVIDDNAFNGLLQAVAYI